jgi:phage shock protein A
MQQTLQHIFSGGAARREEPAIILTQYRRAMARGSARWNTDLRVALALCVYLRRRLQERQELVRRRERDRVEAETGQRRPRREKWSRRLERELEMLDPTLAKLRRALEQAERDFAVAEQTRRSLDLRHRPRAADRLAKLGWQRARIEAALNEELSRIPVRGHWEAECAKERARRMLRRWEDNSSAGEVETRGRFGGRFHLLKRLLTRGARAGDDPETLAWEATRSMRRKFSRAMDDFATLLARRGALRTRLEEGRRQMAARKLDADDPGIAELQRALEHAEQEIDVVRREMGTLGTQISRRAAERRAWAEWTEEKFQEEIKAEISQWFQGDRSGSPRVPEPADESSPGSVDGAAS